MAGGAAGADECAYYRPPAGRRAGQDDPAVAHATVTGTGISVEPGGHRAPDLVVIAGPGFRDVLAGVLDPDAALADGAVELIGDQSLLADFTATFTVPYSGALVP